MYDEDDWLTDNRKFESFIYKACILATEKRKRRI